MLTPLDMVDLAFPTGLIQGANVVLRLAIIIGWPYPDLHHLAHGDNRNL